MGFYGRFLWLLEAQLWIGQLHSWASLVAPRGAVVNRSAAELAALVAPRGAVVNRSAAELDGNNWTGLAVWPGNSITTPLACTPTKKMSAEFNFDKVSVGTRQSINLRRDRERYDDTISGKGKIAAIACTVTRDTMSSHHSLYSY